jgi:ADP-heptose:LPS heptosyltransferase
MPKTKILIIRFSSIGDIVWTTAAIRMLKTQLKDVELHFCTKKQYQEILAYNPHLTKLHLLGDKLTHLIKELQQENFDYIIDLHSNVRSRIIKFYLQKKAFTYKKYSWARWWLVKTKQNFIPQQHIAEWYLATLKPLGIEDDKQGLEYYLAPQDQILLTDLPNEFRQGFVAFVVGASEFTKKLPFEKMVELCQKINSPIILVGGKEDAEEAEKLANYFKNHPSVFIFNACGKYRINQSASIIQQAKVVFGHDTGLTHIAAAFKKKVFGIYGGTLPQYLYPYGTDYKILEVKGLACRPCAKAGRKNCPKGHFKCMRELKFDFENTW